jgi:hypothetical protein
MKKRRKKSRVPGLFEMQLERVLEIQRHSVRRVVVEYICDDDPESFAGALLANTIRHEEEDVEPTTFTARACGITVRGDHKGWRILHRRRVIFSGKTYEDFLAEFFPDDAPAAAATQTLNIKTP